MPRVGGSNVKTGGRAAGLSHNFAGEGGGLPGRFAELLRRISVYLRNSTARDQVFGGVRRKATEMRNFIVGALAVAIIVIGYLYYQETKNDASITITAPKIETPK